MVEAVDMLAAGAFEVHVVVEVRVGAAFNGAGSIPNDVGGINDAMNQPAFLERFQGPIQGNTVRVRR